jgi:hypothetical protein
MLSQRRGTAQAPAARFQNLVVTETADEVLLYDTEKHHIHHLNATTAAVWRLCDGRNRIGDIARLAGQAMGASVDEATVRLALTKLDDAGLLQQSLVDDLRMSRMSRRTFMQRAGVASAIAMPAIVSTTAAVGASFSAPGCEEACDAGHLCVQQSCPFCVSPGTAGTFCKAPAPGICGTCAKNGDCNGWMYDSSGEVKCNNCYGWDGSAWYHVGSPLKDKTGTCWRNNTEPPFRGTTISPKPKGLAIQSESTESRMVAAQDTVLAPSVGVAPAEAHAGDALSLSMSGFQGGEQVSVAWSATGSVLGVAGMDDLGSGVLNAAVPMDAAAGWNDIAASGLISGASAVGGVTVLEAKVEEAPAQLSPALSLAAYSGYPGDPVSATVSGFADGESVLVTFAGSPIDSTSNGGSVHIGTSGVAPGVYQVGATGTTSGASAPDVSYEVLAPAMTDTTTDGSGETGQNDTEGGQSDTGNAGGSQEETTTSTGGSVPVEQPAPQPPPVEQPPVEEPEVQMVPAAEVVPPVQEASTTSEVPAEGADGTEGGS